MIGQFEYDDFFDSEEIEKAWGTWEFAKWSRFYEMATKVFPKATEFSLVIGDEPVFSIAKGTEDGDSNGFTAAGGFELYELREDEELFIVPTWML